MNKKKKIEVDISCFSKFNDLNHIGIEDDIDYYVQPINANASFVVEVNLYNGVIDLLMARIGTYSDDFIEKYMTLQPDEIYCNLQQWKRDENVISTIYLANEFSEIYSGSETTYEKIKDEFLNYFKDSVLKSE